MSFTSDDLEEVRDDEHGDGRRDERDREAERKMQALFLIKVLAFHLKLSSDKAKANKSKAYPSTRKGLATKRPKHDITRSVHCFVCVCIKFWHPMRPYSPELAACALRTVTVLVLVLVLVKTAEWSY